jgi:Fe-S cluster assembly protein SufD
MEHFGRATQSRQKFHALAGGRSTVTFNGRIEIHPGADGSDAALQNRNLLLTPTARVNTKPELEIHTRDVRCSHGATVGRLDPNALFYLRSRGIDAATARLLLMQAFVASA